MTSNQLQQMPTDATYCAHEDRLVKLWTVGERDQDLYHKICQKNADNPKFIICDGPPFVSGNLHCGHLGPNSVKLMEFLYMSMRGYNCSFKIGYDCHGLPIEDLVCKENKLDTTEKIKELGLAGFNNLCQKTIDKYSDSWRPVFQRFGRLADFEDDYKTCYPDFMESCIWVFKQLWDKQLVYRGNKVMAYSYAKQTPLSNFEASQNYKEKESKSIYVCFETDRTQKKRIFRRVKKNGKIVKVYKKQTNTTMSNQKEYFVAWTTTPWTLPANLALCVNKDIDYVLIKLEQDDKDDKDATYIMGKNCVANLFGKKQKYTILKEYKGSELVGMRYKPIFPYTKMIDCEKKRKREYKILADQYVSEGNVGTAIVHLAPAFGEDDFRVCQDNKIVDNQTVSDYCPIDDHGRYLDQIEQYKGRLVFDCEDDLRLQLKKSGHLLKTELYKHNYPYCWRSDQPLIYRTTESYYIKVTALKDRLIQLNQTVNWYPKEIGENRFHQWLTNVKDWSVSRFRYYGTPIPIWTSGCGDSICVGSIAELEELTGKKVTNLHPEFVNDLVIEKDGKTYRRIPDIFDCWFESGAVPMGQIHYPFNKNGESEELESREFLSDLICEGVDQTRGWFYTLLVLSTAIFDRAPYRNVICTGLVLDKDGRKLSKKLGNFVDPREFIEKYGADVLRVYFLHSPVVVADCLKFDEDGLVKLKKQFIPYVNGVRFWIDHALNMMKENKMTNLTIDPHPSDPHQNLMDHWITVRTDQLVQMVNLHMKKYQIGLAVSQLLEFIDDLNNWYIKLNRDRLKGSEGDEEWKRSIGTLYNVLMTYCRLWAPFTQFLSEHIYHHLRVCSSKFSSKQYESVLLTDYPTVADDQVVDQKTLDLMKDFQRICSMVRTMRYSDTVRKHNKNDKTDDQRTFVPLKSVTIYHDNQNHLDILKKNCNIIQSELNCFETKFVRLGDNAVPKIEPDRRAIGQFFRKEAGQVVKYLESQTTEYLAKVHSGTEQLTYKFGDTVEVLDQRFYKLYKIPRTDTKTDGESDQMSMIDNDLMVQIDYTYDEQIHKQCQTKRLYSAVQMARKKMGLHPWNPITIILDSKYSDETVRTNLLENLNNATVLVNNYDKDNNDYSDLLSLEGLGEQNNNIVWGDKFIWMSFTGDQYSGKLLIMSPKNATE
jgi:isoleucyl-tRNA synthetase